MARAYSEEFKERPLSDRIISYHCTSHGETCDDYKEDCLLADSAPDMLHILRELIRAGNIDPMGIDIAEARAKAYSLLQRFPDKN